MTGGTTSMTAGKKKVFFCLRFLVPDSRYFYLKFFGRPF